MVGSKALSLVCASSIRAYYIIRLSRILLKLISQKMDHGKLNPLSTLFYSLSNRRSSSRWGRGQYKRIGRAAFASCARLKGSRSVLSLMFFDFLSSLERSPVIRNSTAISQEPRRKSLRASSELLLNLPSYQAEALMKQLQAGEG